MSENGSAPAVEEVTPQAVRVLKREFTWWEHDHAAVNARYVRGLSTRYPAFKLRSYVDQYQQGKAEQQSGDDGGDDRHLAALAVRQAYFELLETTFALLFAYLQAPDAIPVWMLRYNNQDLEAAAGDFAKGKNLPGSHLGEQLSTRMLSEGIVDKLKNDAGEAHPEEVAAPVIELLDLILRNLLQDFNDPDFQAEYNAIKHGHRGRTGGVSLMFRFDGDEHWSSAIDADQATTFPVWERVRGKTDLGMKRVTTTYSIDHLILRAEVALGVLNLIVALLSAHVGLRERVVRVALPPREWVETAWAMESGPAKLQTSHTYRFREVSGVLKGQRTLSYFFSIRAPREDSQVDAAAPP